MLIMHLSFGMNYSATSQLLITVKIFDKYDILHCLFSYLKNTTLFNDWFFVGVLNVSSLFFGTVFVSY